MGGASFSEEDVPTAVTEVGEGALRGSKGVGFANFRAFRSVVNGSARFVFQ